MCNSYYLCCIATSFDSPNLASNARAAGTHKCISPVHQSSQQYATVGKWSKKCIFCWTLQTSYWQISAVWLSSEEWTRWHLRATAQKHVGAFRQSTGRTSASANDGHVSSCVWKKKLNIFPSLMFAISLFLPQQLSVKYEAARVMFVCTSQSGSAQYSLCCTYLMRNSPFRSHSKTSW